MAREAIGLWLDATRTAAAAQRREGLSVSPVLPVGPRGPARGSSQKTALWSARTRAPKIDQREAPHAAPGRSPTLGPLKKGRLVRADQPHLFVRLAFWSTWTSAGVAAEKCVLVRADQDADFWKGARRNLPSGVPCGEGRIEPGRQAGLRAGQRS